MEPSYETPAPVLPNDADAQTSAAHPLIRERSHAFFGFFEDLLKRFTPLERLALYGLTITLGIAASLLVIAMSDALSVDVPVSGGSLIEGATTPARFVNPVIAVSQSDHDIAALVYSGLVRTQADGSIIPDLAERYSVSPDGTTYTFTLRADAVFHDGTPVSAADIAFTIALAQNPDIKSPRRADWEGVSVATPDERTIIFTLAHPYAPFLENATLGVLPKHIWNGITPDDFPFATHNTHPVGSGPFRVKRVRTDDTGAVTRVDLAPFDRFTLGIPHLANISFVFFPNDEHRIEALEKGSINAIAGITAEELSVLTETQHLVQAPLPRVFGVFFNEGKNPALMDGAVRAALAAAIDQDALVENVLGGFGVPLSGPLPPGSTGRIMPAIAAPFMPSPTTTITADPAHIERARALLEKGGWSRDEATGAWSKKDVILSLKIATVDSVQLVATAREVAAAWRTLGVETTVDAYTLSEFNNAVLRPREYQSILFGEVVGRDADLYAFWHSSQRNDPGLNLALYTNSKADTLLTEARTATDKAVRDKLLERFARIIEEDQPAAFLYSPEFLYIIPHELEGVRIGALTTPAERFAESYRWYTETERVWEFLAR